MIDNKISKKPVPKLIIVLVLLVVVIIVLSVSFAWLRIGLGASNNNVIRAGLLDLRVDESPTDGIEVRIEKAIPQSYRQGITNRPYKFTLINNSTIDTDYTISLEDYYVDGDKNLTTSDKIEDSLIRYILVKNGDEVVASNSKLLSTGRAIDVGTISGKTSVNPVGIPYTLYIWIDSLAGDDGKESNLMSKVFNARLSIEAIQHHENVTPTNWQPTYFQYGDPTTTSSTEPLKDHNVFVGLSPDGNKGVCVTRGGETNCFQTNNLEFEQTHIQQVFSDATCSASIYSNTFICRADDFKCEIRDDGGVYCIDYHTYENCEVESTGGVFCELLP